jgi:glyoxylase-like metal-dependent hydrolase (beta-lactamase superfamily II)
MSASSAIGKSEEIVVRQSGTRSDPGPAPYLEVGREYVLFLHPTEIPGAPTNEYYITGGTAGAYLVEPGAGAADARLHRLADEGDKLPDTIQQRDLVATLQ